MKTFENFDLTNYNSYRVRSVCSRAFFPDTEEDLIYIYKNLKNFKLIGTGHNIIFSKSYYEEDFVILNGNFSNVNVIKDSSIIEAESGVTMLSLSEVALENSLSGLEIFYDIPSSLGGAVVMNAGASGEEIKDVITKVRYLDCEDFSIKEKTNQEIGFEFRNSFFQKNTKNVVLKVQMKLTPSNYTIIKEKMETVKEKRWAKQPKNLPNAGSVFKRPKGYYVGAMIDELELKGMSVGGAKISEKHGGFIINYNNATGQDIISLIKIVKDKVRSHFDVELEVEQRVI
jgi:UDP-N-acetylmuramate dehydrogenase